MAHEKYFEVTWQPTGDASRMADAVNHDHPLQRRLRQAGRVSEPIDLTWKWLSEVHSPADYVVTVDGVRVVSPLMRQIFDSHRTPDDEIQWLPATVIDAEGRHLPQWVPHFPVHYDLLDRERSTFGPSGLPIRYVLSKSQLAPHAVTVIAGSPDTFVLAERVVDALKVASCTGLLVMPLSVV